MALGNSGSASSGAVSTRSPDRPVANGALGVAGPVPDKMSLNRSAALGGIVARDFEKMPFIEIESCNAVLLGTSDVALEDGPSARQTDAGLFGHEHKMRHAGTCFQERSKVRRCCENGCFSEAQAAVIESQGCLPHCLAMEAAYKHAANKCCC